MKRLDEIGCDIDTACAGSIWHLIPNFQINGACIIVRFRVQTYSNRLPRHFLPVYDKTPGARISWLACLPFRTPKETNLSRRGACHHRVAQECARIDQAAGISRMEMRHQAKLKYQPIETMYNGQEEQ